MKKIATLFTCMLLGSGICSAQLQRMVCDETCKSEAAIGVKPATPSGTQKNDKKTDSKKKVAPQAKPAAETPAPAKAAGYSVVSPVGRSSVEMIQQGPRLSGLDGKTIAVVGVSFMTHVTHPEIKRLILKDYPTAKVLLLDEIGFAGPYPAPGIVRQSKEEFQEKLKSMHVDAVISGNGGCGLCTPKETGSCIAAEYLGIPSVVIAGPGFVDQARYTALNNGVPVLRIAEYPGAFALDDV